MKGRLLVHDGTFAALADSGDITGTRGASPDGLFRRDARHLSRWLLEADGAAPGVLSAGTSVPGEACVLTPQGTRDEPPAYTVFREQAVTCGRLTERVRVVSNRAEPVTARLTLRADADFADQFELRSDRRTYDKDGATREVELRGDGVEFTYRRAAWTSRTTVTAEPAPDTTDTTDGALLTWDLPLPAHGTGELLLQVTALPHGAPALPPAPRDPAHAAAQLAADKGEFTSGGVVAQGVPGELRKACEQGLADLASLRVPGTGPDGEAVRVPAAGVPWFLTLFGRDSLLTSLFSLDQRPALAAATLRALAAAQAGAHRPDRVAEPGKIVHEIRHGELAHFGQVPYGSYYGSVDGTPLFLVLLHAHAERTGDLTLAHRLESHARAAVDWLFSHGGLDAHGWLVYHADERGLANQNWKDSEGAICFPDGTQAEGAVAVAEAQGYAYDALRRTALLARTAWRDAAYADRLDRAAGDLKSRFHEAFWVEETGFPALALDGAGRRLTTLASDAGHLLWSGILGRAEGERTGRRLMEHDFFSGWGVRTLAADQAPYHPLSYHRGSIWPHDNAVIVLGLVRYGLLDEARTLADALTEAAAHHGYRLPEVMAGYDRALHRAPVPYPHSCSPQAWAAATPLALLTAYATRPA
ncbi:amylo-alpha-1,6-glucosidase [Streptomyces luteolus]|uniref:Glycogen debranching N-terminal domain-containing protein n=1 Tax=Streptomyces luteolus TaxID=3043615 RepID=A0ABT6SX03_9ACTN|nr:glycogen debranching N-terminal domain-containing protein [Streptomyces sp. B-S-A12]MDI3419379.1 glycogen debranching N-terminal domain-containing protein [Streptomyces sp. B-S-A12]